MVVCMNYCTLCKCHSETLSIRLNPTLPDEKLAFVERVCGLLIESRFGPGRPYQLVTALSREPGGGCDVFYDRTGEGLVPSYEIGLMQDAVLEAIADHLIEKRRARALEERKNASMQNAMQNNPQRVSPIGLARGSPEATRGKQGSRNSRIDNDRCLD